VSASGIASALVGSRRHSSTLRSSTTAPGIEPSASRSRSGRMSTTSAPLANAASRSSTRTRSRPTRALASIASMALNLFSFVRLDGQDQKLTTSWSPIAIPERGPRDRYLGAPLPTRGATLPCSMPPSLDGLADEGAPNLDPDRLARLLHPSAQIQASPSCWGDLRSDHDGSARHRDRSKGDAISGAFEPTQ